MNPTVLIVVLSAMLVLSFHLDRRRRQRDCRAEDSSVAAGFRKWLMGSPNARVLTPQPMPEIPKTVLRVSGSVPPESWNMLGTALLSTVPSRAPVSASLDVTFMIDRRRADAVTATLNSLIAELELSGLRIKRVDAPKKFKLRRVVIRFRDLNPLLLALLPVRACQS